MKDALGHGSAAHSTGVQQTGQRYHVKVTPYSLDEGKVGQITGPSHTVSMHRSIDAAGRSLASVIRNPNTVPLPFGGGRQYLIHDMMTGDTYTRNGARAGTPRGRGI